MARPSLSISRLLILLVGLLLGIVAAELVVRLFRMAPEVGFVSKGRYRLSANEKLGYEPTPGLYHKSGTTTYYDYYADETNALGYRDYDHSLQKPKDTLRVVVLGDSVAMGWGIKEYSHTFPAILEAELRSNGVKSEVLNFAVTGYNTQQEIETLKAKGLRYKPDLVLVAYCLNDRVRSDGDIMKILLQNEKNSGKLNLAAMNPYFAKSALYRFVRYRLLGNLSADEDRMQERYQLVSQNTVRQYFEELRSLSKKHGFSVLITVFPSFFGDLQNYKYGHDHTSIRDISEHNQFDTLDLLDVLQRCQAQHHTRVSIDHLHPNQLGHLCVGKAMAVRILQMRQ